MAMMISKFHKIIQSKIVWGCFAVLISVAFVGVSIPGSKGRSTAKREQKAAQLAGRLFGENVSRREFAQAYQNTRLNYILQYGPVRIDDQIHKQISQSAWHRIVMLKKAEQLEIKSSPEQTISIIQHQPMFYNQQTGQFDPAIYNAALQQLKSLTGMTAKNIEAYYAEQVIIEKLTRIPIQNVLVTDQEIKKAFHLYTDKRIVEYTSIPRTLADTPEVTEEDAKAYFNQNGEQFIFPAKAIVHYVQFAVADVLDRVEVTDEMISGFYENNKQRFLKKPEADATEATPPEFYPLEEVQAEVSQQIQMALARKIAADQADELVSSLADETMTFKKATEEAGLTIVENTPAFALTDSVKNIDPTAPFQHAAFALEKDETHYYSDPVVGRDFVYVIALVKKLNAFPPAFDLVKEEAMESAKTLAAQSAYTQKSDQIRNEIKQALKGGATFADAISTYKLELNKTESFDLSANLEDEFGQQIKGAALFCDQGNLTDLISTSDEYIVAYVSEKTLSDEVTLLPSMRDELLNNIQNEKAIHLVTLWRDALFEEANFEDLLIRADADES